MVDLTANMSETVQYTFFSSTYGIFSGIDNLCAKLLLKRKKNINKFKAVEIIQTMLSNHNQIKLGTNNRTTFGKSQSNWVLNNTFLNHSWVKKEITREIRKYLKLDENENVNYQHLRDTSLAVANGSDK